MVATPQGVTCLPSALISLVDWMDSIGLLRIHDFETTEHDAPESSSIRVLWLLSVPYECATLFVHVLCVIVGMCACIVA